MVGKLEFELEPELEFGFDCETSIDCSLDGVARKCYFPEGSLATIFFDDIEAPFCDCSSWYGFTGANCTEVSPQVVYFRTMLIIFTALSSCLLVVVFVDVFRFMAVLGKTCHENVEVLFASVLVFLANLFAIVRAMLQIPDLYDPTRFIIEEFLVYGITGSVVTPKRGFIADVALEVANSCMFVSVLLVALTWIRVANTVSEFQKSKFKTLRNRMQKLIVGLGVVYIVINVLGFFIPELAGIWIITPILSVLFAGFLFVGRIRFLKVLEILDQDGNVYEAPMKLVRRSGLISVVGLLVFGGLTLAYSAMILFVLDSIKAGTINSAVIVRDCAIVAFFFVLCGNQWYLRQIMKQLKRTARKKLKRSQQKQDLTCAQSKE